MENCATEKIKKCPECNAAFTCSPSDCWCSKLPPVMPMIENAECYCPACLEQIISTMKIEKSI